jgi:hypothetical protein
MCHILLFNGVQRRFIRFEIVSGQIGGKKARIGSDSQQDIGLGGLFKKSHNFSDSLWD